MSSVEKQPVPLGGSRVPESMGGSSCPPWQELPEQTQQQTEALGAAGNAVMTLRENIGSLKKQLSGLAPPMKEFIYSADATDRSPLEAALSLVDAAASSVCESARAASDLLSSDCALTAALKAEASKVLATVRCEAAQQAADGRALCLVTADKAAADAEQRREQQQQQQKRPEKKEFAKELYGDFNLQLGPITRKLFASQTKLLALIKNIKKQTVAATFEDITN